MKKLAERLDKMFDTSYFEWKLIQFEMKYFK